MFTRDQELRRGLAALRLQLWHALDPGPGLATVTGGPDPRRPATGWSVSEAIDVDRAAPSGRPGRGPSGGRDRHPDDDANQACSSAEDGAEASRLIALVELARGGDADAFGMLYDHYQVAVYRFVYYRVGAVALAEDLTAETFFRALRSMGSFRWQGKDFGAWLMTIARNLTTDHFKAGRTRLEYATEDMSPHDEATDGPESSVLASIANDTLLGALKRIPHEQQECLIMRFLQGLSIAETAKILGRSDGAVKQLQLRGVRNLAKLLPEGMR
jgi:RNA polymerase sigma-70 factor, ECF subfamily